LQLLLYYCTIIVENRKLCRYFIDRHLSTSRCTALYPIKSDLLRFLTQWRFTLTELLPRDNIRYHIGHNRWSFDWHNLWKKWLRNVNLISFVTCNYALFYRSYNFNKNSNNIQADTLTVRNRSSLKYRALR